MDFKVFQLFEQINYENREHLLANYLRELDFFDAGQNLRYLINNDVEVDRGVLVGSLSEEFIPNAYGINEDKSIRNLDEFEPYERTLFAFDFSTRAFLVQNRKYSPKNLDPGKTLTRIQAILNNAFQEVFESNFNIIPTVLPEDNELFLRLFNVHRVTEILVNKLNERNQLESQVAEDIAFNQQFVNYWNNDDSHMDMVHIKTTSEGELNNNPIVLAAIHSPNAIIDKIRYFDPEEDKIIGVSRSQLDKFVVNDVDKETESVTAFEQIITQVNENRRILRRLRQID
ncbi:hypothetical protein ACFRH9_17030 [Peribacillus butanolivorans]|uniref:hypothetical protein n=2 Tax=Peribacillus TaxID=2675229 RepID=UPI00366F800F